MVKADSTTPSTRDEIAARGEYVYDTDIRMQVEADHNGKILVLDIASGDYEIDESGREAAHRLMARRLGAELYALRVGYQVVGRIGGRRPAMPN